MADVSNVSFRGFLQSVVFLISVAAVVLPAVGGMVNLMVSQGDRIEAKIDAYKAEAKESLKDLNERIKGMEERLQQVDVRLARVEVSVDNLGSLDGRKKGALALLE